VTSVFAAFGHLGVGTSDSHIYFITASGEIWYSFQVSSLAAPIRDASFHGESTIACLVGAQPHFLTLDRRSQFDRKLSPFVKPLPITDALSIAINYPASLLAIARGDGSALIISIGARQPPATLDVHDAQDRLLSFFWSLSTNVLVIVRENGAIELYLGSGAHLISTKLEKLVPVICTCFDCRASRLFCSDMNDLFAVGFGRVFSHFVVTSARVVDSSASNARTTLPGQACELGSGCGCGRCEFGLLQHFPSDLPRGSAVCSRLLSSFNSDCYQVASIPPPSGARELDGVMNGYLMR
jgi:hypothetical protein